MKIYSIYIAILIAICSLLGCHSPSMPAKDKSLSAKVELADSLFAFVNKDLSSTDFEKIQYSRFHEIDSLLKVKILLPIVKAEKLPMDDSYATSSYLHCDLIAKEKMIGSYLPIVIHAHGDDCNVFYYVLLDSNSNSSGYYRIFGNFGSGEPGYAGDSLVVSQPQRGFRLNNSIIRSYDIRQYIWLDSLKNYDEYDSISYTSRVEPDGKIRTEKGDSVRSKKLKEKY